jgi:hypothetical protein
MARRHCLPLLLSLGHVQWQPTTLFAFARIHRWASSFFTFTTMRAVGALLIGQRSKKSAAHHYAESSGVPYQESGVEPG